MNLSFAGAIPYLLLPTLNGAKGWSFQPVIWINIIPPSAPFSWSPNLMHKSFSPCPRALCPLSWQNIFLWMWEMESFPPPTAALLLLLPSSVYSCHSLCSLWATPGKVNCKENPGRRNLSGSRSQGRGHVISEKRVERSHTFFSFFKQNDRHTERKGSIPLQTVGCSDSMVH